METEDLRRGNLILTSEKPGGKKFLRSIVEEIKAGSVVVRGERTVLIEDCDGIPLNEEWMRMYGFDGLKKHVGIDTPFYYLAIYPTHGEAWLWDSEEAETTMLSRHVKYVHQLQNLYYALTGEELKILTPV